MRRWSVAIIGGGPGGLMLAYRLQQRAHAPFAATIYEATDRLGGKILTERFSRAAVPYEAGAAELYDYSRVGEDPLRELVAELGLTARPMGGATVILGGRAVGCPEDVRDAFGTPAWRALERFDRAARDWMSPREFYRSDWKDVDRDPAGATRFHAVLDKVEDASARRYLHAMVHSDLATEPHQTNAAYGLQNYLMNDPAYMRLYSIDGGIERLPRELARRVGAEVRLAERVVRVGRGGAGRLRVASDRRDDEYDFVVAALPNNLLPRIEWAGGSLAEAMRRHHDHYDYPAHYLRVSVLFEKPFWRGILHDSYCMLDAFGGCCLYDETSRNGCTTHGVLGWLLGGEAALAFSERSDDELIQTVLASLPANLQHGRDFFIEGRVHRWVGAVNGLPAGFPPRGMDVRHRPESAGHPDLFVVGDYLFDSTLNGVLDSAEYVAEWLAVEMSERAYPGRNGKHP